MAILSPSGLETHPLGASQPNDIINSNWSRLNDLFGASYYPYAPRGLQTLEGVSDSLEAVDVSNWLTDSFVFTKVDDTNGGTGDRFRVYFFRDNAGAETMNAPILITSSNDPTKVFELIA